MKKRSSPARKPSTADLLISPETAPPSDSKNGSPKPFGGGLNLNTNINNSSSKGKIKNTINDQFGASTSVLDRSPRSLNLNSINSISDIKDLASSRLDSLKRHLDHSHSEILKDIDSCHSHLRKRFKIQTQACQQVVDEAENEYKKMLERIKESQEAMKASYSELISEVQASAARVCKTTIPELLQSFEKAIDALRSRFGITPTT